jgi:hypothetical protein
MISVFLRTFSQFVISINSSVPKKHFWIQSFTMWQGYHVTEIQVWKKCGWFLHVDWSMWFWRAPACPAVVPMLRICSSVKGKTLCAKYAHLHMEIAFHILVWCLKRTMYQIKHILRKIESLWNNRSVTKWNITLQSCCSTLHWDVMHGSSVHMWKAMLTRGMFSGNVHCFGDSRDCFGDIN